LGRHADAIRAGERALADFPEGRDALLRSSLEVRLAAVYGTVGEYEKALDVLENLLDRPLRAVVSPALLRLDPDWDPLRGHPRFRALMQRPDAWQAPAAP
jgi:tetratricopeptide (TPR) repeat protein